MYTPPLGNAVNFDFTVNTYTPPTGTVVIFAFATGAAPNTSQAAVTVITG